jgi:hypothetical protein
VVEEIEKKDPAYYDKEVPEYIKERYSKRFSSFGMSKEKRGEKLAEIVEDGLYLKALVEKVPSAKLDKRKQLEIMGTIFEENVTIRTKELEERIFVEVEEIQSPKQSIFDPRDPSVKMGIKGKTSWVGSKCHVVETAEKGKINFITDMVYQNANKDDSKIHGKIKEGHERNGLKPEKLYTDGNYLSGALIHEYRENGQELMGYKKSDNSKKPEGFKLDRFVVDMKAMKATCPAGGVSINAITRKNGDIECYFSKAVCRGCKHFVECVGVNNKSKRRVLRISPYYADICERRKEQKTESFQKEMSVRAQVEGTISEAVRYLGFRYAKYKGESGHQLQFYLTGAAVNVKRLIRAWIEGKGQAQMATTN